MYTWPAGLESACRVVDADAVCAGLFVSTLDILLLFGDLGNHLPLHAQTLLAISTEHRSRLVLAVSTLKAIDLRRTFVARERK